MRLVELDESVSTCDECRCEGKRFVAFDGPEGEQVFICAECLNRAVTAIAKHQPPVATPGADAVMRAFVAPTLAPPIRKR